MKRDWKRVILPGLVFQSVLVGGGYGTGAEIGRYFGFLSTLCGGFGFIP